MSNEASSIANSAAPVNASTMILPSSADLSRATTVDAGSQNAPYGSLMADIQNTIHNTIRNELQYSSYDD
jgi:hypothetical protein